MTGTANAARRRPAGAIRGAYRAARDAHFSDHLRWLRAGVLLCVAACAGLYLWVAIQAENDIAAIQQTRTTISALRHADRSVLAARKDLNATAGNEDMSLVGTGSSFNDDIFQVEQDLTDAAEGTVAAGSTAGPNGTAQVQFAENQLVAYVQASETLAQDYAQSHPLVASDEDDATAAAGNVQAAISSLSQTEAQALARERGAWPLRPALFWSALLVPLVILLALAAASHALIANRYRRHASPLLWAAVLAVAVVMIVVGLLNAADARSRTGSAIAGNPAAVGLVLAVLLVAAVLAFFSYRERLAEYEVRKR